MASLRSIVRRLSGKTRKKLATRYDESAWSKLDPSWDNNFSEAGWLDFRRNIVDWVLELRDDHDSVLDTACNMGHFIGALRNRGYTAAYSGVDITPHFIEQARRLLPDERFEIGDIRALTQPDRSVDLVMCVGVLMHLPEIHQALGHVFRIARKYVMVSAFGSPAETFTRHDPEKGFLNFFFAQQGLLDAFPEDWTVIDQKSFKLPNDREDELIHQFLLRRDAQA